MKTEKGTTPVSLQPAHPAGCMCFPCQHGRNYATFLARDAVVQAARDWRHAPGLELGPLLAAAVDELERLEGGK